MTTDKSGSKPFLDFTAPRTNFDTSVTDVVRIEISRYGATAPSKEFLLNNYKEFTDFELQSVWVNGLGQSWDLVELASQYKTNAGRITDLTKLVLGALTVVFLGYSRFVYRLTQPQSLTAIVDDPFFNYVREFAAETVIYNCKVLDLTLIPQAVKGSEVKVFVKYTHGEVSKTQIDQWMELYGTLLEESRY